MRVTQGRRLRYAAFAAVVAVLATAGAANAATINNGSFTNGLAGWTNVNHGSGTWQQVQFIGPAGRLQDGLTVPTDPGQTYAAGTSQGGPGDHTLYQDVALESGQSHILSLDWNYNNFAGRFYTPNSLSYSTNPNQQARIDVINPSAPLGTLTSSDILATVMTTTISSPAGSGGWHHGTVDLSAFAGSTVRLRLVEVDNQSNFTLDATNVHITSTVLNHAPTVTVAGVTDGAKYEFGSVPAATCQVSDVEDGPKTLQATLSAITGPLSSEGLGSQTASCSYTDAGGLTATASATYSIVDTTAPVITVPANQSAEATGPNGAAVTYTAPTALDAVDGAVTPTCDHASGDAFPLGATIVTCTATDNSGNTATKTFTVTVVDTTPPAITVPGNLTATATSAAGAPVQFTAATATDLVDGTVPATCDHASGDTFALGTTTITCTSTDAHQNTSTKSFTVTVTYSWSGVLAPFTSGGAYHLGRTLPVQFTLTGASAPVTNAFAKLYLAKVTGGTVGPEFPATSTSAAVGDNSFRYDGTGYIFNLATKGLSAGSYQLRVDLGDGVPHTVNISLS